MSHKSPKAHWQRFYKYGIVGASAALINLAVFALCEKIFGIYYLLSTLIAFVLATYWNFILARKFVFVSTYDSALKESLLIIARDWLIGHIMQEDKRIEEWNAIQIANNTKAILESTLASPAQHKALSCKLEEKPTIYVYQCHCKIHKVSESTHSKINKIDSNVVCKECKYPLQFLRQE